MYLRGASGHRTTRRKTKAYAQTNGAVLCCAVLQVLTPRLCATCCPHPARCVRSFSRHMGIHMGCRPAVSDTWALQLMYQPMTPFHALCSDACPQRAPWFAVDSIYSTLLLQHLPSALPLITHAHPTSPPAVRHTPVLAQEQSRDAKGSEASRGSRLGRAVSLLLMMYSYLYSQHTTSVRCVRCFIKSSHHPIISAPAVCVCVAAGHASGAGHEPCGDGRAGHTGQPGSHLWGRQHRLGAAAQPGQGLVPGPAGEGGCGGGGGRGAGEGGSQLGVGGQGQGLVPGPAGEGGGAAGEGRLMPCWATQCHVLPCHGTPSHQLSHSVAQCRAVLAAVHSGV
jgi:hypothetical protein